MARSKRNNRFYFFERLETRLVMAVSGSGTGLVANYFADAELKNLVKTRVDSDVNFNWGQGSPDSAVPADGFSARWVGKVQAQYSEVYNFYTNSDEGVALWVNGQKIIDNFTDHTLTEESGTITLAKGEVYTIRLEYYDNAFEAEMHLSWSSPSTAKQVIPTSQLYPDTGYVTGAWLNADIGSPSSSGSVNSSNKTTFNVIGGGSGIGGTSDALQLLYQTLDGDGTIVTQVSAQDSGAQAGVMLRDSLSANSAMAALVISPAGAVEFKARGSNGASVSTVSLSGTGKYWLKLQRDGDYLRGFASATGADGTWTHVGSVNIPTMDRTLFVGAFSSANGSGTKQATFKTPEVKATVALGAGLDSVRDWGFGQVFVDAARQMRAFQGPNLGPAVGLDANGYATADFMTIFISGFAGQNVLYNGTYKGSFTGQADLNSWLTPGGSIQNKSYNAASNTTTFDLIVNANSTQDNWYVGVNFLNTRRTAASATGTGVTNIRLIRPGYDPVTTQTFQTNYLEHIKQFSVLRFMDWTVTNDNPIVEWSERVTPTSARQASTNGVAWEYVIELANQVKKDVWINIPAKASDNYIQQLATLFKNTLDPSLVVYLEYSNEVWNGIFDQFSQNLQMAVEEVNAGGSPLNSDGETNQIYWGWRHTAKRIKEASDIFAGVYGADAINGRVRPVLAGQHANPLVLQEGIEFLERTYGAPSKFLYGVAAAPYYGSSSLDSNPNATVDQYINGWSNSINNQKYFNFGSFARRYGLQNMTYEAGPDTFGGSNVATKRAASLDPRTRELVSRYLTNWYNAGGGLFEWFVAGPTNWNTSSGTWGLSNAIDNLNSPKNLGTLDVANASRPALKYGIAVPGDFDARAVSGATQPYSTTYRNDPGVGNSFDYYLRVPATGMYTISLSSGTAGSNEQLRFAVNDTAVRTITLKNTGSTTTFAVNQVGTFYLEEGMNLVHVTSIKETTWNIQTVTVGPANAPDAAPTVATPANASPMTVMGKTTNLSVLGADNGGESNLVYSWEAIDEQATSVTFSANGTNGSKNTTATFTRAGTYQLRVTISDGVSSVQSSVTVSVNQVITSVTVTPSGNAIANGETKQLTAVAKDQFGVHMYTQPPFAWIVDNAFGTVSSSGLYQSPANGLGTATVRATTTGSVSGTATVITQSPRPADTVANPLPGIEYSYYEGAYNNVVDFDSATPIKTGLLNNISVYPRLKTDNFAFIYTGYVLVPGTGTYTFYTTSDDGSKLWIGGQQVVNNDGKHSAQERSGTIILDQGWHPFKLSFFDATGGESLSMSFSGPGISFKQPVPDANLQRADKAPTVATPAAANPSPATTTTSNLSVVGADESGESILTYTWSATSVPSGAVNPTFSVNGTNAAKNSTATFFKAGTYTLQVAISDGLMTTNATVTVTVQATVTSISASPANPSIRQNRTQQFNATARDQFNNVISSPPAFIWAVQANGGTINASGLYTAPDTIGSYQVTASINGTSGSTTANVIADNAPTVVTPASATPNPVTGSITNLSVLGDDDGGEAGLIYTWAVTTKPGGANDPTYSINGTNAAKNAVATFTTSGNYTLTVTISDGFRSVTNSVNLTVGQNLPTVVTPASAAPSPVSGTQTALSVLGDHTDGEGALSYTWSLTGSPPAGVTFSINGTNAARNTTATFTKAGMYNFLVTISNESASTTSNVSVVVNQTLTSIVLSPTTTIVVQGATRQFTAAAKDQFGDTITSPGSVTWSVTSTGTAGAIAQSGLYTAPATGTPTDTIRATIGSVDATASVTVVVAGVADTFGQSADIGGPSITGSYSVSGTTYTVKASGADIWNSADQFHFVYKTLTGDGQIVARVASVQNTHNRAKAGVMMRESLAPGSRNVNLAISPDNTTGFQYRTGTNFGTSSQSATGTTTPYWLKIVRAGNTFTGFRSSDGTNWTQIYSVTSSWGSTIYVGLSLTSHDNTKLNTSTFDNVAVTPAGQLIGTAIGSAPTSAATAPAKIVDGSSATYFAASSTSGAWVGLDLSSNKIVTSIRFSPRSGYASQLVGGKFQVSSSATFSSSVIDLYTIKVAPTSTSLTTITASVTKGFRYVRYLAPNGSAGNIAELRFFGV